MPTIIELQAIAKKLSIHGRSKMNKAELERAIADAITPVQRVLPKITRPVVQAPLPQAPVLRAPPVVQAPLLRAPPVAKEAAMPELADFDSSIYTSRYINELITLKDPKMRASMEAVEFLTGTVRRIIQNIRSKRLLDIEKLLVKPNGDDNYLADGLFRFIGRNTDRISVDSITMYLLQEILNLAVSKVRDGRRSNTVEVSDITSVIDDDVDLKFNLCRLMGSPNCENLLD